MGREGDCAQADASVGAFTSPLFPRNVSEKFRGPPWHSFRWRHDVDLKNEQVGVIGNGCSVRAQSLPIISEEQTTEVINVCRSPQWFVKRVSSAACFAVCRA
ncbi:hypothetical protein V8E55_010921 [Tylopilus felleus]